MNKKMNELLADLVIVSHKIQAMHWYVKGHDFFHAHEQLEAYYNQTNTMIDEVAEAMLMSGEKPIATCKEFLDTSDIKEKKGAFMTSEEAYDEIAKDFKHLLELIKDVKAKAEEDGNDLVTIKCDNFIEQLSKDIWMLEQR